MAVGKATKVGEPVAFVEVRPRAAVSSAELEVRLTNVVIGSAGRPWMMKGGGRAHTDNAERPWVIR